MEAGICVAVMIIIVEYHSKSIATHKYNDYNFTEYYGNPQQRNNQANRSMTNCSYNKLAN